MIDKLRGVLFPQNCDVKEGILMALALGAPSAVLNKLTYVDADCQHEWIDQCVDDDQVVVLIEGYAVEHKSFDATHDRNGHPNGVVY